MSTRSEVALSRGLDVPSLVDAVDRALRQRILSGEIPAGSLVTENAIATEFSVARPTAKAAVERLVHDGMLRRSANKTARVPVLDADEIRDLYSTRNIIERAVVSALSARRHVPDDARAAQERFDQAATRSDVPDLVEHDVAFHLALVASVGSERLSRIYRSLVGEVHLCMAQVQVLELLDPRVIAAEHAAIVDAIVAGNRDRALAEIDAHLDNAGQRILAAVTERRKPSTGAEVQSG